MPSTTVRAKKDRLKRLEDLKYAQSYLDKAISDSGLRAEEVFLAALHEVAEAHGVTLFRPSQTEDLTLRNIRGALHTVGLELSVRTTRSRIARKDPQTSVRSA
jgi:hypothetical protein